MLIRDYYLKALQNDMYKKKVWVIEIFSKCDFTIFEEVEEHTLYDYQLVKRKNDNKHLYAIIPNGESRDIVLLDDYKEGEPVCAILGRFDLKAGDLVNVTKDITTTFGNAFINCYILIYPFGNKFEFMAGEVKTGKIEDKIAKLLTDTPAPSELRSDKLIYVDEYLRYGEAMQSLEGFSMLCVQAASPATMIANPLVKKRRDELFEEYKDQLDDPAILAKIQMELSALDKELLKDDIANNFYMKSKSFDIIRMKRFTTYGREGGFGDVNSARLVKNSLDEGWDIEALPNIADAARSGSYARGKETALGGETVKDFYRIFQNVKVVEEDCGSKLGFTRVITAEEKNRYIGLSVIDNTGKTIRLTNENIDEYLGKPIKTRSPMLCKTKAPNYCKACVSEAMALRPDAVHIVTSDVGSAFMYQRMKAMHGKSLRTLPYVYTEAIS